MTRQYQIARYIHHGQKVSVQKRLQGKHRSHCLCWQGCVFFKPDTEGNCPIAKALFALDKLYMLVTPVWECASYRKKRT